MIWLCCNITCKDGTEAGAGAIAGAGGPDVTLAGQRGIVRNRGVTGRISRENGVGALFYEGEDVTVENCSVDFDVENCSGVYAGAAVNLSGSNNRISNVSVKGGIHVRRAAGFVDTMEGGIIKNVGVSIDAEIEEGAAEALRAEVKSWKLRINS